MQEKWKIPLGDYLTVCTENPEKPLESDRCVSYRISLTFSGVCQYLLAYLVTFILLNENIKAWSCQWNGYKDNIRSQDAIHHVNKAEVQISTVLKDEKFPKKHLPIVFSIIRGWREKGLTSPINVITYKIIRNLNLLWTSPYSFVSPSTSYAFSCFLFSILYYLLLCQIHKNVWVREFACTHQYPLTHTHTLKMKAYL